MKKSILALLVFISACGTQKQLTDQTQAADKLFLEKNYTAAYQAYNDIISQSQAKGKTVPAQIFASAGKSLYLSNKKAEGIALLDQAEAGGFVDEQSLLLRIYYYKEIDNMSKELTRIEQYKTAYPNGSEMNFVNERLFLHNAEMKEYPKVKEVYALLDAQTADKIANLEIIYKASKKLNEDDNADKYAARIFEKDPENLTGLRYKAESVFYKVENEYVAAIKAYNKNQTTSTYNAMRKKIDPLAPRFKAAKNYYIKLYSLSKEPADAAVLSRICERLNDPKNAKYYKNLSKKQ